jgi:hypothetical protein
VDNLSWQPSFAAAGIRGRLDPVLRHHCRARAQKKLDDADGVKAHRDSLIADDFEF